GDDDVPAGREVGGLWDRQARDVDIGSLSTYLLLKRDNRLEQPVRAVALHGHLDMDVRAVLAARGAQVLTSHDPVSWPKIGALAVAQRQLVPAVAEECDVASADDGRPRRAIVRVR